MIHSIRIQRFRSIDDFRIDCGRLTTFIGMNDAGKSNVVRALNLFFNGQTDHDKPFNFENDFNKFSVMPSKKAKEIIITVSFSLPETYAGYPKIVSWRKTWRADGEQVTKSLMRYSDGYSLPAGGGIPTLLRCYNFTYIPAIKDPVFFADLLGKIYDTLSKAGSGKLGTAGEEFNNTISTQVEEFLNSLGDELKEDFKISLPENLRSIFENLKISNKKQIPLERRGDGIKIRHIPELLLFLVTAHIKKRGVVIPRHIWAFEEPENNLEFSAASHMARRFEIILKEHEKTQIFLTTHSPVFYKMELDAKLGETKKWFISKDDSVQNDRTHSERKAIEQGDELDARMGFLPFIAEYTKQFEEEIRTLQIESKKLKKVTDPNKKTIFVEGKTDKAVIQKAINVFQAFEHLRGNIQIICCDNGGKNSVKSSLQEWHLKQRHCKIPTRAAGLIDKDLLPAHQESAQEYDNLPLFNSRPVDFNSKHAKLFYVDSCNDTVKSIYQKGYRISKDLESLYSDIFWRLAEHNDWLEVVKNIQYRLPKDVVSKKMSSDIDIYEGLIADEKLRVQYTFSEDGKIDAVKYIRNAKGEEVRHILEPLKIQLEKIFKWLNSEK